MKALKMVLPCPVALSVACLALAGCAAPAGARPGPVCLAGYSIDHTDVQDDRTILFTLRDHSVYRNRLTDLCVGLRNDPRGFTYAPTNPGTDEICDNQVSIRLNGSGAVCELGIFERLPPPRHG